MDGDPPPSKVHDFIRLLGKPVVTKVDLERLEAAECQEAATRGVPEYKFASNEEMLVAMGLSEKIASE
jgi:hypothetical protein